jgi:hypothetical protein
VFVASTGTNQTATASTTKLSFNPSTGVLTTVSTQANYADLAELYEADADYEPGTVLEFGGVVEVTVADSEMSTKIAGVVSLAPAYLMNSELDCDHVVAIALQGRVPVKVIGPVAKGDMLVSASNGYAKSCENPRVGSVIGKSLENFTATPENPTAMVQVVVGRD